MTRRDYDLRHGPLAIHKPITYHAAPSILTQLWNYTFTLCYFFTLLLINDCGFSIGYEEINLTLIGVCLTKNKTRGNNDYYITYGCCGIKTDRYRWKSLIALSMRVGTAKNMLAIASALCWHHSSDRECYAYRPKARQSQRATIAARAQRPDNTSRNEWKYYQSDVAAKAVKS